MFRCRRMYCSNGVECMEECRDEHEVDPEYLIEQAEFMSDLEMDRVADEYFDQREQMLDRNRP